jgi:hypothetical protein
MKERVMKKSFLLLFIAIIISLFIFLGCPGNDGNGEPTPEPGTPTPTSPPGDTATPTPVKVVIEDFESSTVDDPPGGNVSAYGCDTSCSDNTGVVIDDESGAGDGNYVVLMKDIFGEPYTYGEGCTGYSYIQIDYTFPQDGTLSFDCFFKGYNPGPGPSFVLSFWKDFTGDIASPGAADNTYNTYTIDDFDTYSVDITAGSKTLTWRIVKDGDPNDFEDDLYIDNIVFEYQE